MKRFLTWILLTMTLHGTFSCRYNLRKELDDYMTATFPADQPGAAVMVVENGKIRYSHCAGLANLETRQPITPQTTFRMASVSKQFTAMAILILEKQGKLDLTQKIGHFFPKLQPAIADSVTIGQLLTHTSGIPDYETLLDTNRTEQLMDEDIPALLESRSATYFKPGTSFRYSNTGFCLLALIVQQVSGKSYPDFMKEQIFVPLGMSHSFIYDPENENSDRAMGYSRDANNAIIPSDQSITSATKGDGCVYTCLDDYYKWYQAIRDNKLIDLPEKLADAGFIFPGGDQSDGYGMGWFFIKNGQTSYELTHSGSTSGFSNVILSAPSHDFLIVYFSNLADHHAPFDELQAITESHSNTHPLLSWKAAHKRTN